MNGQLGERRHEILAVIKSAGAGGIARGELARRVGLGRQLVFQALQTGDMIYEECRGGKLRLFWCGGEDGAEKGSPED